jgi:hemerythrin-like metal-binding protein
MSLMDWDAKKFDILVPAMNDQHQKLIAIMNKLYDRHAAKAPKAELNLLLVELRDYTIKHFREEEALLESMQFPQVRMHKSIHEKLLSDFTEHYNTFCAGTGAISSGFFEFLRLWLTAHILHIDRKYGEFSKERSAA